MFYLCFEGMRQTWVGNDDKNRPKQHQTHCFGPSYMLFSSFYTVLMLAIHIPPTIDEIP